jgi:hypothetical protein
MHISEVIVDTLYVYRVQKNAEYMTYTFPVYGLYFDAHNDKKPLMTIVVTYTGNTS